jgi:hypothetical protein
MTSSRQCFFDVLAAISLLLCLATISLWIAFGNNLHQIVWLFRDARYSVFIYGGSIGGSYVPHWPNRGLAPTWMVPALYLPLLPVIVLLALPLNLRLKRFLVSDATNSAACALRVPFDIGWICLLVVASVWFVGCWLPMNRTDDPGVQAGGSASIILLVALLWTAGRDLIKQTSISKFR